MGKTGGSTFRSLACKDACVGFRHIRGSRQNVGTLDACTRSTFFRCKNSGIIPFRKSIGGMEYTLDFFYRPASCEQADAGLRTVTDTIRRDYVGILYSREFSYRQKSDIGPTSCKSRCTMRRRRAHDIGMQTIRMLDTVNQRYGIQPLGGSYRYTTLRHP